MIETLLPAAAATAEVFQDPPTIELLAPEEAFVANAVDKRRREFATVRLCARNALSQLGVEPVPILPGPRGAPCWPAGIVGSMTHCLGYRAAAVGRSEKLLAIGIDAEPNERLPRGVLEVVAITEEQAMIATLARRRPEVSWDRVVFSAKESAFKAWFPLTFRWLDFRDAVVTIDAPGHTFGVRLRTPDPLIGAREASAFHGRWLVSRELVTTAIAIPRPAGRSQRRSRVDAPVKRA